MLLAFVSKEEPINPWNVSFPGVIVDYPPLIIRTLSLPRDISTRLNSYSQVPLYSVSVVIDLERSSPCYLKKAIKDAKTSRNMKYGTRFLSERKVT